MRLPVFLIALVTMIFFSTILGIAAGFGLGRLTVFLVAVVVILQLAYVAFVALAAAVRLPGRSAVPRPRRAPKPHGIPQKADAGPQQST